MIDKAVKLAKLFVEARLSDMIPEEVDDLIDTQTQLPTEEMSRTKAKSLQHDDSPLDMAPSGAL